jgi:DtxR family transcriptional regulator, Mn-dependent transcriptional regulator
MKGTTVSGELTRATQEYLEALYWLYESGIERTPTNVARAMQVSPPSVTEMVRKLQAEGLVSRGPGRRISLTAVGERAARRVVNRHRLVEAFLVKVMGVPWDDVHEEAETFEMGVTPSLEARMLAMIGEAKTCPHGHPIGDYPREPGVPLTAAPAGSVVRILRFENEDQQLLRTFKQAGVEPAGRYRIAAFGTGEALLDGASAPLPLQAARTISVAVEEPGAGEPAERDPESLATAYLLGETHWSR